MTYFMNMSKASIVAVFTVCFLVSQLALAAELTNGGFEDGPAGTMPTGWQMGKAFGKASPGATIGIDTTIDHSGKQSLKMTSEGSDPNPILQSDPLQVEEGAQYAFSVWLKAETSGTNGRIMVVPSNYKNIAQVAVAVTDQWKEYKLTFKSPRNGGLPVMLRVDLMQKGAYWIDDATFTKTAAAGPAPKTAAKPAAEPLPPAADVSDGSFEQTADGTMPTGWSIGKHYGKIPAGAKFGVDSTVAHGGSKSLKVMVPSETIPAIVTSNQVTTEIGQQYVMSAWMKADTKGMQAEILLLGADYKGGERLPIVLSDQWQQYRVVMTPAGNPRPYFARIDLRSQGTLWIDDVKFTQLADNPGDNGPFIGYRSGDKPGAKEVAFGIHGPNGQTVSNINGVCFCRNFGAAELDPRFKELNLKVVRLHNVLTQMDILKKDASGQFTCNFTELDKAVDRILSVGAVPQMCLCFTPLEMRDNPEPAKVRQNFYLGPPSDMKKWEEYIYAIVHHCAEKYPNVADWYWIQGNEPGVAQFSMGTQEQFYEIYQHTVAAAVKALPNIKIGAGSFAHPDWLQFFVERCGKDNTRVNLVTWHLGNTIPQDYLAKIAKTKAVIAKNLSKVNPILAIDEWEVYGPDDRPGYLNSGDYGSAHTAASIYYMIKSGLSYQTWFISHSKYDWGMIGQDGTKHGIFNLFKMYTLMNLKDSQELAVTTPDDEPYVGGFAAKNADGTISAMVWYPKSRNDTSPNMTKSVTVSIDGVKASATVTRYLVDHDHSNGLENPQRQELETAPAEARERGDHNGLDIRFEMPANSVSMLVIKP